ncbi:GbpC/Spa domain-containing protein [Streptococcus loxodontisalivarius]|uniref:Fibronectin-binding protein A n=1 Tax=Streptococcus loxodontisalivarius TaxID=1349415 RepID=A0ABS2PQU0_9STRE|nr:GbpC/Spa domain-containing protein [Streptococcus loxodontisalivarius]MBM7642308.1 fibronectin-binding protein A [Streptococcus loxodontisalivarius]
MKSFKDFKNSKEVFSIRKKTVGVVSLAIAASLTLIGAGVSADEVATTAPITSEWVSQVDEDTTSQEEVLTSQEQVSQTSQAPVQAEQSLEVSQESQEQAQVTSTEETVSTESSSSAASTITETSRQTSGNTSTITYSVETPALTEAVAAAKEAGLTVTQTATETQASTAVAIEDNEAQAQAIAETVAQYQAALAQYQAEQAQYEQELAQYQAKKDAYDQYQEEVSTGTGAGILATAQDLILTKEPNAVVAVDGLNVYITKEGVKNHASDDTLTSYNLEGFAWSELTSDNQYAANEDVWGVMYTGDTVTATYTNLENAKVGSETIAKIVYSYTLVSSTSDRQGVVVRLHHDPTQTITIGSNTDNQEAELSVDMSIKFYNEAGQEIDLSASSVIMSLSSLNHWNGMAYVTEELPQAVQVQAKDIEGNLVTVTVDVYADGSKPSLKDGLAQSKSLAAAFGDTVVLSKDNPAKFVVNGQVLDASSIAALDQNGNTVDADQNSFGTYTLDPLTGLVTYTPTVKYDKSNHIEKVTIGNNTYIQIPGSSVTNQDGVVYAVNDNEYMAHGSTFNAENGWDDPASATYYYGSAAIVLKDGNLNFAVSGNEAGTNTVYWFAVNSTVAVPEEPGQAPVAPEAPETPSVSYHENQVVETVVDDTKTPDKDDTKKDRPRPGCDFPSYDFYCYPRLPRYYGCDYPSYSFRSNPCLPSYYGYGCAYPTRSFVSNPCLPGYGKSYSYSAVRYSSFSNYSRSFSSYGYNFSSFGGGHFSYC